MRTLTLIWAAAFLAISAAAAGAGNDAEHGVPSPDVVPAAGLTPGEELDLGGSTTTTHYLRAAGSNFHPRESATAFSYAGGGCVRRDTSAGDSWFSYDLDLPDGAVIDFLRVYYYDNSGTYDIYSELWAFDGAGGTSLVAEADGSGSPGYGEAGSGFFARQVDSANESFVVVASIPGGVGSALALCGIRVRYQYPDQIFSDGFESGNTTAWTSTAP